MKKPSLKERFSYWFDNQMSKGSIGLVRMLLIFTFLAVLLISAVIMLFGFNGEEGFLGVLWNSIATIINAWMPSFEEGSVGYIILMALAAFAGLLVTSVLIGIFTSAIEEKIVGLRKGNSPVIEEGHIVLIGFYTGEYTLLRQLILAAKNEPCTIVIGSEMERDELEDLINDNVDVPDNIKIICRTVDPYEPNSLEKLSVSTAKTIIVSPTNDDNTIKMLLAVSNLLDHEEIQNVTVNAILAKEENRFPPVIAAKHKVTALQSNDTIGKLIAHSCTQTGLSEVFKEIFDFEGSEFYLIKLKNQTGLNFKELLRRMDGGVPVGIMRDDRIWMNPEGDMTLTPEDEILVYATTDDAPLLSDEGIIIPDDYAPEHIQPERDTRASIFGNNSSLKVILRELPDNVRKVTLVNYDKYNFPQIKKICQQRNIELELVECNTRDEEELLEVVANTEHVIIQGNYGDEEEADMNTIFLLLNLRELREKYDLQFNITAEMLREKNQTLIETSDRTDFIVASNMSSLFLAQLAENPRLVSAFREILSNEGNELYMKKASNLSCVGTYEVSELRQMLFVQGYIFLGCLTTDGKYTFNPMLHDKLELKPYDSLIVFGEE